MHAAVYLQLSNLQLRVFLFEKLKYCMQQERKKRETSLRNVRSNVTCLCSFSRSALKCKFNVLFNDLLQKKQFKTKPIQLRGENPQIP
jgi:hypothetical protein